MDIKGLKMKNDQFKTIQIKKKTNAMIYVPNNDSEWKTNMPVLQGLSELNLIFMVLSWN